MRTTPIVLMLLGMALPNPVAAQQIETGFLDRSVVLAGTEYRYQVFIPRNYQESQAWPVVLALHGGGSYGSDGITPTVRGIANVLRRYPDRYPAIVVFPQSPAGGDGWQEFGGRVALAALDGTLAEFHTDSQRVYLTGLSAGGNGSWYLSYNHPERFAAVIVVCGFVEDFVGTTSGTVYAAIAPASSSDAFATIAERISGIPIWIFHGDADPVVSVEQSRRMTAALRAVGADVQYTEFPGVGHNAWDPAYALDELPAWLFAQRKR